MDTQTTAPVAPLPGMGATEVFPQDRYPLQIVKVSPTGHAIWVVPVLHVGPSTGHTPAGLCNGFPVWDHTYTRAELGALTLATKRCAEKATRRNDGTYRLVGSQTRIAVGSAHYYRNFAD